VSDESKLAPEELERQEAEALPDREVMSTVSPESGLVDLELPAADPWPTDVPVDE
jgi:hypothetical protein